MPHIDDIAKELNLRPEDVRVRLRALGEPVDYSSSSVTDEAAQRLREDTLSAGTGDTTVLAASDETTAVGTTGDAEGADAAAKAGDAEAAPSGSVAVATKTDDGARTQAIPSPQPPATTKVVKKQPWRKVLKAIAELPILVIVAFLIAVLIKTFLVQAFFIPSGSMVPTLRVGDRVLVEKISYFVGEPARGQVVVFARNVFGSKRPDVPWYDDVRNYLRELLGLPTGEEEDYIKRIVATEGDTIRYEGKPRALYINGEKVDETDYINNGRDPNSETLTKVDCKSLKMKARDGGCLVPAGKVFVMGDNRANSQDSRVIGPIDEDKIIGRAFLIIWPPKDFGTI